MKVNAQAFFNFCARHVPLLRALAALEGEVSDVEALRLIRSHADSVEEMPETTWRRLVEFQILVPSEPGSRFYLMAAPVTRVLTYLFDEANPATPEMIRGYIGSLEALCRKLRRALEIEDVTVVELAFREINDTLRRIYADLEETHRCILNEVALFKTTRHQVSVREKFRRIVHWMERLVEPMIDVVRADGPLRASFEECERLLHGARERSLFNDDPALSRNLRYLRLVRKHALRIFQQCLKEIQPLYEALRRSSYIAEGAALALARLQSDGLEAWGLEPLIGFHQMRVQNVPSDQAIARSLDRLVQHASEPVPHLVLDPELEVPTALLRRQWLDSLPETVESELPVMDLMGWLIERHPERKTAELLSGFTTLVFHADFRSRFTDAPARDYVTPDGSLQGSPVSLDVSKT